MGAAFFVVEVALSRRPLLPSPFPPPLPALPSIFVIPMKSRGRTQKRKAGEVKKTLWTLVDDTLVVKKKRITNDVYV